jgi:hypothetical protein
VRGTLPSCTPAEVLYLAHGVAVGVALGQTVLPVAVVGTAEEPAVGFVRQVSASLDCLGNTDVDQAVEEPVLRACRI